jgi:hypothetical protein
VTGFENTPTEVLLALRANLLAGLDEVARHLDAGTFHTLRKASCPSQSGQLTVVLLEGIDAVLAHRDTHP